MKPKGQAQPHNALPSNIATIRNEAKGSQGKVIWKIMYCIVAKASPTVFAGFPKLWRTGRRSGCGLKPKRTALNNKKNMNCTMNLAVLIRKKLCFKSTMLKTFSVHGIRFL